MKSFTGVARWSCPLAAERLSYQRRVDEICLPSVGKCKLVESRLKPRTSSCDPPINELEVGKCHSWAFPHLMCSCKGAPMWASEPAASLQTCRIRVSTRWVFNVYSTCLCAALMPVCVRRLNELWRVGFMSQQVTDDQINWSRAPAFSGISSMGQGFAGASRWCH